MSQTYTIDCYDGTHGGQADLLLMEQNFESLRTSFSGAGAPAGAVQGTIWCDTTNDLLKIYNAAATAYLGVMTGDTSQKVLVYRNAAGEGWAVDANAALEDRVIAVKGGATYTTGGAVAGSWTLPDYTLLTADIPAHTHTGTTVSDAHKHTINNGMTIKYGSSGSGGTGGTELRGVGGSYDIYTLSSLANDAHTHTFTSNSRGGDGSHNHGATYRPAACVVTVQYMDI